MNATKQELLSLSNHACGRLADRIEGMTDEEYFWEPTSDCWSVRPKGDGTFSADWGLIFDEVPPVTTIAWRMTHIIDLLAEERCATWIGVEPESDDIFAGSAPGSSQAARELLDRANARWQGYVTATDADELFEKVGPIGRGFADATRIAFILHIIDELIHHAAEVAVLRDLYRAECAHDPVVSALLRADRAAVDAIDQRDLAEIRTNRPHIVLEAAATGRWDAVPYLIELGFGVDGKGGRTPLHHAAADGRVETMRMLIAAGADPKARDPIYKATPLQWAEFFDRREAADLLRQVTA